MVYKVGRFLQAAGLFVILPVAIAGQALDHLTQGQMLIWTGVGVCVFLLGRSLQQSAGSGQ